MTRDEAFNLVCEFTKSDSLRKHMLAVEAAMVFYAGILGEDATEFAITGLLHDFDYESHPDLGENGHPFWGVNYLRENTKLHESLFHDNQLFMTFGDLVFWWRFYIDLLICQNSLRFVVK